MILQAYIDESYNDRDSDFYVLAGYVSSVEKWAEFSREWEERLPLAIRKADNSAFRFKMSEMAARGRMADVPAFHNVINRYALMSVACVVDRRALLRVLKRLTGIPLEADDGYRRVFEFHPNLHDPFFFAFRALMDSFHRARVEQPDLVPIPQDVVDFYFDDRSDKRMILDAWEDYIEARPEEYRHWYGREPRFEDDEEFLPLQAADFRAWWVRKWSDDLGMEAVASGEAKYPFAATQQPLYHLMLTADEAAIERSLLSIALDVH